MCNGICAVCADFWGIYTMNINQMSETPRESNSQERFSLFQSFLFHLIFFFFLYCHFILHCKGTTHTAYFGKCRIQMDFQRFVFRSKLPEQAYTFLSRFLWLPGDGFNFCPGHVVTGERKCGHAGWIKSVTSCTAVPKRPVSRITVLLCPGVFFKMGWWSQPWPVCEPVDRVG